MPEIRDYHDFIPLWGDEFTEENITARARENVAEMAAPREIDTREGSHMGISIAILAREGHKVMDLAGLDVPASAIPLWAWAHFLDDHAELQEVFRLPSTPAEGWVLFTGAPGEAIPPGVEVGVPPPEEDAEAPSYQTTEARTIQGPLATPGAPTLTPSAANGTLATDTYYYVVTATDAAGETVPGPEASVAVAGPSGKVTLSWTAVPNATGYRVYRSTDTGGPYGLVGGTTDPLVGPTTFIDTGFGEGADPPVANSTGGMVLAPVRCTETGTQGNVGAHAIVDVLTPPPPDVTVDNPEPTAGGTDPEPDERLRERLIEAYKGKGAGSVRDYKRWARAYPGVGRVTVIPQWNGPGTVRVIITDPDGDPVSDDIVLGLQNVLEPVPDIASGDAPIGARVTVSTAGLLTVKVDATIEFEDGFSLEAGGGKVPLEDEIVEAIDAYVDRIQPGEEVVLQQVVGAIVSVEGVHDVGDVELNDTTANVAVDIDPPLVPYVDWVSSALTEGSV